MGRVIDADKFKKQVAAMTISENLPIEKANALLKLIDIQPTAINGVVKDAGAAYMRTTSVKPTEHHYEEPGEKPYIKYSCPVCESLGNLHQVNRFVQNCPVCGVQLYWGEYEPVARLN